ncbi:MAG: hypothetical protein U0T82_12750 [Bacteroidales bacterium]
MKNAVLILLVFILGCSSGYSQSSNDSIVTRKRGLGTVYYKDNKMLNMPGLVMAVQSDEKAFTMMKSAQTYNVVAAILGGAGGFMIGYPLGTAAGGGEANWKMATAGAGLVAICIPFGITASRKAKEAVRIYNSGLQGSILQKAEWKLAVRGNGIGLLVRF